MPSSKRNGITTYVSKVFFGKLLREQIPLTYGRPMAERTAGLRLLTRTWTNGRLIRRLGGDLSPGTESQLLEDVGYVLVHRARGEHQFRGDLAAGEPSRHQGRDLLLAAGELG